jgi:hypothetical protein
MGLSGNFNLQDVRDLFGPVELNSTALNVKGLSQFHAYIFTSWNPLWNPRTLKDFTGLGRPVLQTSITVPNPPSWNSIKVDFNITEVNNQATLASPNIQITVGSMNTEVAVDYYVGSLSGLFPNNPNDFETYEHNITYNTTGAKSLTFTPDPPTPNTTYQLRLRYYNRFNKLSTPQALGTSFSDAAQGIVPINDTSVGVTTPSFPQLPPPFSIFYRIEVDPRNARVVWIYRNVTDGGSFITTPNVGYQPNLYLAETKTAFQFEPTSLVSNSTVNWGSKTNFNKGAVWRSSTALDTVNDPVVRIQAKSDSTFTDSVFVEAELYPYPNPITVAANFLSTTSVQFNMNLQNVSSAHPARYYWTWRYTSPTVSDYFSTTPINTTDPLTTSSGTKQLTLTVNTNSTIEFRARAYRDTDIFVDTFGDSIQFLGGEFLTVSTDIRPSSVTQELFGSGGFVTLTVTWSHPPAYSNGLPTGGTYTVQILNSASQLVTQVTGISGTTTSHDFTNICSLLSDGDFIKSKVIANIPNIGTGERLADNFIEVLGCATENGGGNGGIGGGL